MNPYDQFDSTPAQSAPAASGGNPYDQFDGGQQYSKTASAVAGAADTASYGFGDEMLAGAGASALKVADWLGVAPDATAGKSWNELYNTGQRAMDSDSKQAYEANPASYIAGGIGGALLTGGAAAETKAGQALADWTRSGGAATRIAKSAGVGAASGAVYGAGSAEQGHRIEGAEQGAKYGAAFGTAAPVITGAIGKTINSILPKSDRATVDAMIADGKPITVGTAYGGNVIPQAEAMLAQGSLTGGALRDVRQRIADSAANTIDEAANSLSPTAPKTFETAGDILRSGGKQAAKDIQGEIGKPYDDLMKALPDNIGVPTPNAQSALNAAKQKFQYNDEALKYLNSGLLQKVTSGEVPGGALKQQLRKQIENLAVQAGKNVGYELQGAIRGVNGELNNDIRNAVIKGVALPEKPFMPTKNLSGFYNPSEEAPFMPSKNISMDVPQNTEWTSPSRNIPAPPDASIPSFSKIPTSNSRAIGGEPVISFNRAPVKSAKYTGNPSTLVTEDKPFTPTNVSSIAGLPEQTAIEQGFSPSRAVSIYSQKAVTPLVERTPGNPQAASQYKKLDANYQAGKKEIDQIKGFTKTLKDEDLARRYLNLSNEPNIRSTKGADAALYRTLEKRLPEETLNNLNAFKLSRMGIDNNGAFNPAQFAKEFNNITPEAKAGMLKNLPTEQRAALHNTAQYLSSFKGTLNPSGSGAAVAEAVTLVHNPAMILVPYLLSKTLASQTIARAINKLPRSVMTGPLTSQSRDIVVRTLVNSGMKQNQAENLIPVSTQKVLPPAGNSLQVTPGKSEQLVSPLPEKTSWQMPSFIGEAEAAEPSRPTVTQASLNEASHITGISPKFMNAVAKVESSLNPNAKAKTSSASGLFQFTKDTWNQQVQKYGKNYGIENRDIMNPEANALMAGHLMRDNYQTMSDSLGRVPTGGELYAAHMLGARKASQFINNPNASAASLFPAAARANRNIFFQGGKPRTAGQVLKILDQKIQTAMQ